FGKKIISYLRRQQIGETVRELGLEGQNEKAGTPTMGGIIIIMATLIPVLLLARLENIYVLVLILTTVGMGVIGFLDDYIKVCKKDEEGLRGKVKVVGQIGSGVIVGAVFYSHRNVTVRDAPRLLLESATTSQSDIKSAATTIPFLKNNEF